MYHDSLVTISPSLIIPPPDYRNLPKERFLMLNLTGSDLSMADLVAAARNPAQAVGVDAAALKRMDRNRRFVESLAERGESVYGLTTGVGIRKKYSVAWESEDQAMLTLQVRIPRPHSHTALLRPSNIRPY